VRILFVAMAESVHTARWINQLAPRQWDIHVFPADDAPLHPDLRNVTVHGFFNQRSSDMDPTVRHKGLWWPFRRGSTRIGGLLDRLSPGFTSRSACLARLIRRLKPDLVHSLEITLAGYQTLAAKRQLGGVFPPWIVTNWGSDIYLFGRLSEHASKIRSVLSSCDYYSCECHRDVKLARDFGFAGVVFPTIPNAGGYDVRAIRAYRQPGPTSARRLIVLKGYQHWAGRALVGLHAIEKVAHLLHGYRVAIFSASQEVKVAAELLSQKTGLPIDLIPRCAHADILRLHGRARASIGLSISDAISTSVLEAMVMGSLPIQSNTSCATEWVQDGVTALIVPPEDVAAVADAIRRAVTDDALVDHAAEVNGRVAAQRLDYAMIQAQSIAIYENVAVR
jgi:glycosyltransferase involved in cell wall biosynthesis